MHFRLKEKRYVLDFKIQYSISIPAYDNIILTLVFLQRKSDIRKVMSMISWWSESAPFIQIFGGHHFIYISIIVFLLILLLRKKEKVKKHRKRIAAVVLTIFILQQILLYGWYIFETGFDISESLPLHISRITSLFGIYFLITKNLRVLDIIFFFGLFAYASFLYPQRVYPIYHVIGLSFLINHAITLLLPYFAYIAYDWRPKFSGLKKAYTAFLVYFTFVYFLNPMIDGNYFYLKHRPFLQHWPDYLYVPGTLIGVRLQSSDQ